MRWKSIKNTFDNIHARYSKSPLKDLKLGHENLLRDIVLKKRIFLLCKDVSLLLRKSIIRIFGDRQDSFIYIYIYMMEYFPKILRLYSQI